MSMPSWRATGASVPGARHLDAGRPGEDAYAHALVGRRADAPAVLVLAVADGAGSAARAVEGAAIAAGAAVAAATALLAPGAPDSAAAWSALAATLLTTTLRRHAGAAGVLAPPGQPGDLASTLTCALVAPPWLCLVSVGDGFVVVRRRDGSLHLVVAPRREADAWANETFFLTSPQARERARSVCLWDPELDAVALSTDGLLAAALRDGSPPRPEPAFLGPLIEHARDTSDAQELHRYLLADEAVAATTDDDRTLLVGVAT
jgi:hypothetical protein